MAPPVPLEDCREHLVRSALAVPSYGVGEEDAYADLASKAAALAYSLAKAHACIDGNKRVALILSATFLGVNGYRLEAEPAETDHIFRHVAGSEAAGRDDVLELFTNWFAEAMTPNDGDRYGR